MEMDCALHSGVDSKRCQAVVQDHRLDVEHDSRAYGKGGAAERQAGVEEVANLLALNSEVLKLHAGDSSPHWGCDRY